MSGMVDTLLPACGGPACGQSFPMGDGSALWVFDDSFGVAHRYEWATDDGERVWQYAGPESLEAAMPEPKHPPLQGWRVG